MSKLQMNFRTNRSASDNSAWITVLIAFLASNAVVADETTPSPSMIPASLSDSPRSLQNRIQFPKLNQDIAVTITCAARLDGLGEFVNNYCWRTGETDYGFINVIKRAARDAKISPAKIDGVSESVWFQYSVDFRKVGDNELISVYPNWGFNRDFYGTEYIAPQLYYAVPDSMNCNINQSFTVSMYVDEDSSIHDPEVINGEPTKECRRQFLIWSENARFIPAHHDGQPVPARYVDLWFAGPNKWTGRGKRHR
jgi:hypothetical protein